MRWSEQVSLGVVAAALLVTACDDETETHPLTTTGSDTAGGGGTDVVGGSGGTGLLGGGGSVGGSGGAMPCEQIADTTTLVTVPIDGGVLCIDATEVTRGQYEAWLGSSPDVNGQPSYCSANASFEPLVDWPPSGVGLTRPVVGVDWCDALAYCTGVGKRLCGAIGGGALPVASFDDASASEWFNVCSEGGEQIYPYGDTYLPAACNGIDAGNLGSGAVGSMPGCRGSLPVFDLSGNVYEWEDSCDGSSGGSDPCRIRGGAYNVGADHLLCAEDAMAARDQATLNMGIRCCADPPS